MRLLQRLTELSDALHPKKEPHSSAPSVKPATPVVSEPTNPWEPLTAPLRQYLSDWPHITLHSGTLTAPEATFAHFEAFLTAAAASKIDRKTRACGRAGLNCLKNLIKLAAPGCPSTKKAPKNAGRLTVLGQLLAFFAKLMGLEEEIILLDFNKSDIAFLEPQPSASHTPPKRATQTEPPFPEIDGPFFQCTDNDFSAHSKNGRPPKVSPRRPSIITSNDVGQIRSGVLPRLRNRRALHAYKV